MKKTRKVLLTILSILTLAAVSLGAASCFSNKENSSSQTTDNEFRQVYAMYVTYAEEQGVTPLSYEDWLKSIRGEQGPQGEKGDQGEQGPQGDKGDQGDQGVGIEKVEYDEGDNLVITFTDGTTQTVEIPEPETHVHTFGDWITFSGENEPCENKIFYHVCTDCNIIEWKQGSYADHAWSTEYTCDDSYHWNICDTCGKVSEKEEHTYDESYTCSICGKPAPATEGVLYQISSDNTYAEVIGYEGTAKRVRIADTYNDLPVKTISYEAFYENRTITAVKIPDSVTSIGQNAFNGCSSLTSVVIPDSVTSIGKEAFCNCSSLTNIEVSANNANYQSIDGNLYTKSGKTLIQYAIGKTATSFSIPDSVTSIGYEAFYHCRSLTSVVIGDSVTSIGEYAFWDCRSLTSVIIPDSVTSIGSYAFSDCNSLTSVEIPDSVTSIGYGAFYHCRSLTFHEYGKCQYVGNEENPYYALIQANAQNYSSYTIHEDTKVIADRAFYGCARMSSIVIPDSVTSIGDDAFYHCSSLTSVEIPDSVTSIGSHAFAYCSSLTSVVIGDSVTSIGGYAFWDCRSLTSVVIGGSMTSIGMWAFHNCNSLTSVYYKGTASEWPAIFIDSYNSPLKNATWYYYSETEPTEEDNYWHYVDGEVTIW